MGIRRDAFINKMLLYDICLINYCFIDLDWYSKCAFCENDDKERAAETPCWLMLSWAYSRYLKPSNDGMKDLSISLGKLASTVGVLGNNCTHADFYTVWSANVSRLRFLWPPSDLLAKKKLSAFYYEGFNFSVLRQILFHYLTWHDYFHAVVPTKL